MEVSHGLDSYQPPASGTTITIGNFDGVHRGHQQLIATARAAAAPAGTPVVVLTFEPHPSAVLAPEKAPARLVTPAEKLALLAAAGVDACIMLASTRALFAQTAEEFLTNLARRCRPRGIVEGPDFRFGRGRAGSVQTLREFAGRFEFAVHVVETWRAAELPAAPAVRSSVIRAELAEGHVSAARVMLGRPYRVQGTVGRGAGRGARLGFATANLLDIPHLLPQEAVYAAVAQLADGRLHLAAVNIGPQPTFADSTSRVEAHLLDWSGDLAGRRLGLHFIERLRAQRRFADRKELAAQIEADVGATRSSAGALEELRRVPPIPL